MKQIDCQQCGTAVLVEKYSIPHTSVQWVSDAATSCPRFAEATADARDSVCGTTALSCSSLSQSIDDAVREGRLPIKSRVEPVIGDALVADTL